MQLQRIIATFRAYRSAGEDSWRFRCAQVEFTRQVVFGDEDVSSLFYSLLPCSHRYGSRGVRIKSSNAGDLGTPACSACGVGDALHSPERGFARAICNLDLDLRKRDGMHRQRFLDGRAEDIGFDERDASNTRCSDLQLALYRGGSFCD